MLRDAATVFVVAARPREALGTAGLTVHYVASVLGAGVLILPGVALELAGPASILSWLALVLFSYLFAWVLARLSVENPNCHGLPLFAQKAFGRCWERGIALLLAAAMATIPPVYGIAAARRLADLGLVPSNGSLALPAMAVVLAGVGLNLAGLRIGARVQFALMASIVGVLVATIGLALPAADAVNLTPVAPNGWMAVGTAMALCFFAVIGWENAAPLVEKVPNPTRVLPRAVLLAVTLVGVLYLAVAITAALTTSGEALGGDTSPVSAMLRAAAGDQGERVGSLMALFLLILCANAWILGLTRMLHALARNGILPRWFAYLSGREETPIRACVLSAAAYVLVLSIVWGHTLAEPDVMAVTSAMFLVIYAVVLAAALKLLRRRTERMMAAIALVAIMAMIAFHAAVALVVGFILLTLILLFRFAPNAPGWQRSSAFRSAEVNSDPPL